MTETVKILIAVTTRNRPVCLDKILGLLLVQTLKPAEILVVDNNSDQSTFQIVHRWQQQNPVIKYLNTGANLGGAGGEKVALDYAVKNQYDAVWTMDDDCEPEPQAFAAIVDYWQHHPNRHKIVLNSLVKRLDDDRLSFGLWQAAKGLPAMPTKIYWSTAELSDTVRANNYFPHWGCFYNGTFLPTYLIKTIGTPRPEFFIRGDEVEYLYRLLRAADVGTVLSSVVRHPHDQPGQTLAPWKRYYQLRNYWLNQQTYFPTWKTSRWWLTVKLWIIYIGLQIKKIIGPKLIPKLNQVYYYALKDAVNQNFKRDVLNQFKP